MSVETAICAVCGQATDEIGRCRYCDEAGHAWNFQDWRPLLTLALVIVLGFSFTKVVVNRYDAKRQELSAAYYAAGARAMAAQNPSEAVEALESALIYSHNNFQYQLRLTDALLASGAMSEAVAQLHAFLDQRPGDAQVDLKLARLEARRFHVDSALHYYRAAIDGDWPKQTDSFAQRIAVRFESAEYLVEQGRREEAEGALQELAAVLPAAWPQQGKLGDLFLRNGDSARALQAYQTELNLNPDAEAALLGAAKASLATANYAGARRYLLACKPPNGESRHMLAQLDRMQALDPFAPNMTAKVRAERTITAFHIATERLVRCGAPLGSAAKELAGSGADRWAGLEKWNEQLAPLMDERKLSGHDDVIESTMRFAFQAEISAKECGATALDDEALLLLARERLGAGQ